MKAALLAFFSFAALSCLWPEESRDYKERFNAEYTSAETTAAEALPILEAALDGNERLARIGMAVVFPEITRYNILRDTMETTVLELSYMAGTSLDFSIGQFQMKTSFAAMMEKNASPLMKARFPDIFINSQNSDSIRRNRIKHLKAMKGQVEYLAIFLDLMNSRLPCISMPPDYIIRIYATAYNTGYQYSIKKLNRLADVKLFPYGKRHKGDDQYSYYKISLEYWNENFK